MARDILEIFGYASRDVSVDSVTAWSGRQCPFIQGPCTKTNHDKSEVYGTCSVSNGVQTTASSNIIICPNRLYANNYATIKQAAATVWPSIEVVIGGTLQELKRKALAAQAQEVILAFGKNSGREIGINANGQMSMDWVLQRYAIAGSSLRPVDFVGIEVQSIDITGNYRESHQAYTRLRSGETVETIPPSGHGLNWANVHKRLIPQIIRKGNLYSESDRCRGFFFILPDAVYKKFEQVLGELPKAATYSRENLTILTYALATPESHGSHRGLVKVRTAHHTLADIKHAFSNNTCDSAPQQLDKQLREIFS
jgi:hypothetical protein